MLVFTEALKRKQKDREPTEQRTDVIRKRYLHASDLGAFASLEDVVVPNSRYSCLTEPADSFKRRYSGVKDIGQMKPRHKPKMHSCKQFKSKSKFKRK